MRRYYIAMALIVLFSVGAVIMQYQIGKGPAEDQKVVTDLQTLQTAVQDYADSNRQLPDSLNQVTVTGGTKTRLGDYQYEKVSYNQFKLCATFNTDTSQGGPSLPSGYSDPMYHGKGYQCFTSTAVGVVLPEPPVSVNRGSSGTGTPNSTQTPKPAAQ